MDKVTEIEKQLNLMFQFMFKENKKYIFIEKDPKGFIDINIVDKGAYNLILNDKSAFAALVNDYLNVHDVRIRRYKGDLPDLTTKPELLKEVSIKEKRIYIKQRIFVLNKALVNKLLVKEIHNLRSKIFTIHETAWNDYKERGEVQTVSFEAGLFYGKTSATAEIYQHIKIIEKILK